VTWVDGPANDVEQQLTFLLRRGHRVHLSTQHGDVALERSAYGILCQLADDGPQRLGALAAAFGLDASTLTRQAQDLERSGLAFRSKDPTDGRAFILDLTASGRDALERTRDHRRERLAKALADWPEAELSDLGRLLRRFNRSIDRLGGHVLVALGVLLDFPI
jgi:DNA-binding MarR family transcriptional regulator